MTQTVMSPDGSIEVRRTTTFQQGGIEGIIGTITSNPLLAGGIAVALVFVLMTVLGNDFEEEVADKAAERVTQQLL